MPAPDAEKLRDGESVLRRLFPVSINFEDGEMYLADIEEKILRESTFLGPDIVHSATEVFAINLSNDPNVHGHRMAGQCPPSAPMAQI